MTIDFSADSTITQVTLEPGKILIADPNTTQLLKKQRVINTVKSLRQVQETSMHTCTGIQHTMPGVHDFQKLPYSRSLGKKPKLFIRHGVILVEVGRQGHPNSAKGRLELKQKEALEERNKQTKNNNQGDIL